MRAFLRVSRSLSAITLFFFCWTYLPMYAAVAWAAEPRVQNMERATPGRGVKDGNTVTLVQRPDEKFEKAVEDIRETVGRADDKAGRGEAAAGEIEAIKAKRTEIEILDVELKKEFAATEKKLKDAKLPKEILDRHYKFVKHYEDNLNELKANLDVIGKPSAKSQELRAALQKAKAHLERVKPPKKHVPLDPNKLPNRMVKAKARTPRLKKEEFEKDFPPQRHQGTKTALGANEHGWTRISDELNSAFRTPQSEIHRKPILVAANGPLTGILSSSPKPVVLPFTDNGFSSGVNPDATSYYLTPNSELSTPNYQVAQATVTPPTADDLAETPEVQFTDTIKAKAQELGYNPVKIYNWIRNNIDYQPYYGSFKGAAQTLAEGAGNDFDQASLLIALLRASNIYSKYAYGTVEIPIERVMNWVGGVTDPKAAGMILSTMGIPATLMKTSGGVYKVVQLEHVWVEAWIDYFPSWGARHKQGGEDTWISLDPSFKQYAYKQGMDMYALMGFNADDFLMSYITNTRDITAYQDYGKRLVDFIDANLPDATIEQVFGDSDIKSTRTIVKQEFPYLLGTLPYKTIVKAAQFSQVPSSKDYTITIQIEGNAPDGTPGLNYSGSLNYLADKRVTVAYEPATIADEVLVAQYDGNMLDVPPYLLTVKPILKISGTTVATGAFIGLGQDQNIVIGFAGPDGDTDRIQNIITAGNYSAIILQSQDTPADTPSKNMATLIENSKKVYPLDVSLDDLLGQMLYSIGISYFQKLSFENRAYANTLQLINFRQPAEAMVTHKVKVSCLFGLPLTVSESGLNMDVDRNINVIVSPTQDNERVKAFMVLSGLSSSAWENRILEIFLNIPAASTVRLLKLASEQGIPIYTITGANINVILPRLQVSFDVKTDMANAVNAGKNVIISKTNLIYNQWNGVGYIVMNPLTGAAGYMISGGLAGSDTAAPPSGLLRQGQLPDSTLAIRELVLRIARAFTGTPYVWGGKAETGFDCSGFVYELFALAGPKLPEGNAATQYETCNANKWLSAWNDRLAGDIIWRSNLGHVGIEAGTNEITWQGNPYNGETAVHASGRPCYPDAQSAPGGTPAKCISSSCIPIDPAHPEMGGNPSCGTFNAVIESPIDFFASTRKESVCRPK